MKMTKKKGMKKSMSKGMGGHNQQKITGLSVKAMMGPTGSDSKSKITSLSAKGSGKVMTKTHSGKPNFTS